MFVTIQSEEKRLLLVERKVGQWLGDLDKVKVAMGSWSKVDRWGIFIREEFR